MLEVQNTPFPTSGSGLGPIKRLWRFLIHQEAVQCMFIRYIFGKSKPAGGSIRGGGTEHSESESLGGGGRKETRKKYDSTISCTWGELSTT